MTILRGATQLQTLTGLRFSSDITGLGPKQLEPYGVPVYFIRWIQRKKVSAHTLRRLSDNFFLLLIQITHVHSICY